MRVRHHLSVTVVLLALYVLAGTFSAGAQAAPQEQAAESLTVMTRNLYFGIDPVPLLTGGCTDFEAAATEAYQEALQSDFPARAAAIAAEIVRTTPDFVGVQEGVVWSELWSDGQTIDFLQLILDDLATAGSSYTALAIAPGLDVTFPTTLAGEVRLQVNDVLLARAGADLAINNVQTGTYESDLVIPTCIGLVTLPRQWAAADVALGGETVRVLTTHLEAALALVRTAQARELLAGPAAGPLPTILMGDINSETEAAGDAAAIILEAGYVDSWPGAMAGDTCCQASDLRNALSLLDSRIDLVLARGEFQVASAERVGQWPLLPPPASGVLWASDHAGVVVSLALAEESTADVFLPVVRSSSPSLP